MVMLLVSLIFLRPFISSFAFPYLGAIYNEIFLIFLLIWVFLKGVSIEKGSIIKFPLALFVLVLILSVFFSTNRLKSLYELFTCLIGLGLFIITLTLEPKNKLRLINAIVYSGLIISLLAIYQYFFGFRHLLDYMSKEKITDNFAMDYIAQKRVYFPFITPNALGGYLAMIILLMFTRKKWVWLIIPLFAALLLTKSMGAFLRISLGLIIFLSLQGKLKKRAIILFCGLLTVGALVFFIRSASEKDYLRPLFSAVMRLDYWKGAFNMIAAHPFVGVGLGNFNLNQTRYAHNSYLQIWAETGTLGIISFLWLVWSFLKSGFSNIALALDKKLLAGLIAAFAAFLISNFFDFSFYLPEIVFIWWVITGCLISTAI